MSRRTPSSRLLPGLGKRLREERERLSLTQEQLANQLGITRRTIINHEGEAFPIPLEYLDQLGKLGADCHFLLFGDRVVTPDPAILGQALEWAQVVCEDPKGSPFSANKSAKFVSAAYVYLATEGLSAKGQAGIKAALMKIAKKVM